MAVATGPQTAIRIAGASGYWGDSAHATPQLLKSDPPDYIVYDYLAEITMSILARMRAKDPQKGFATDFITGVLTPNLSAIAASGVRLIANSGGVNPAACGAAARAVIEAAGLDLKVAVVAGDDLIDQRGALAGGGFSDMESSTAFPAADSIASINAYLGAEAVSKALGAGADIVITGRVVDSALTLGACLHEFGWAMDDFDRLAAASLAGHLIECGPQVTGGNHTDWADVADGLANIGYPILSIDSDGVIEITKPTDTGGKVSRATVAEQMLYEIGDPARYLLPDVICDFTQVKIEDIGPDRVQVTGCRGIAPPETVKVCATYFDGWRGALMVSFYGLDAARKAQAMADATIKRTEHMLRAINLPPLDDVDITVVGSGEQLGSALIGPTEGAGEVSVKMAVKHADAAGVGVFLKAMNGMGLTTPPGLASFNGGSAKPQPIARLFSFTLPRDRVCATLAVGGAEAVDVPLRKFETDGSGAGYAPDPAARCDDMVAVPLIDVAWARSGDKGNTANIGVIARRPALMPYIWTALTPERLASIFGHLMDRPTSDAVKRYYLPGLPAMNITLAAALGGGGIASLKLDSQGKGYSQILLAHSIEVPRSLLETAA